MKRVLFVDDEPMVLAGLRNLLRPQRKRWDMHFVSDAREALRLCESAGFDLVVSDMRMPGMDGASLLAAVRALRAATRAVLLTGYAEETLLERARAHCDLVVNKPCDAAALVSAIESLVGGAERSHA